MKVKLKTIYAHPIHGAANPGQMINLPDAEAKGLIAGGYAEVVKDDPKVETADRPGAPEKAVAKAPKGKGKK